CYAYYAFYLLSRPQYLSYQHSPVLLGAHVTYDCYAWFLICFFFREKSALASVVAFEIMEADDDINIFVKDMNANDGERHPRGEKRRRVGNDQKVKVDDREQHWCEERGEKRRRVGHGQQRSHQRDQERSHQHDQERSVERDQERSHQRDQEGSVERDQERSHQRDRHRSVKRDQHRSVECDQQRSRQRDQQQGQEKVVGSDHPSKEQRGREEFITISDIETSFEFDGRLVGKRLVDAKYDKRSTPKGHRRRHKGRRRRRSSSST
ncbi:Os07g0208801, partial [Oryza sativa Japonica Group]